MPKSKKPPRTLWSYVRWFCAIFIIFQALLWAPLGFYFVKYRYFSGDVYADDIGSSLKTAGLVLRYPVDAIPVDCIRDAVGYPFFECENLASHAVKMLEDGQTRVVVAPSHLPEIVAEKDRELGNRILLRMENSKPEYDVIDRDGYDKKYPFTLECVITSKSSKNIFSIYIIKEICGYRGDFIYQLVGMGSDYGYPYNPTGDSVIPLRVTSWTDYSQKKVTNGGPR